MSLLWAPEFREREANTIDPAKIVQCKTAPLRNFGRASNTDPDFAKDTPYRFLFGICIGRHWGWWGPLTEEIGRAATNLLGPILDSGYGTPSEWRDRILRGGRHRHSGSHAVALGVVDLALWDAIGQREDTPMFELLANSPTAMKIPLYRTAFWANRVPDLLRQSFDDGWSLTKINAPNSERGWDEIRSTLDQAVAGSVAVDALGTWSREDIELAQAQADCRLAWIEEPCPPWLLHRLEGVSFPADLAAGEHCYCAADTAVLRLAGIRYWQPDAVFCGGLDGFVEILRYGATAGATLCPHGGGLLPAYHVAKAGYSVDLLEWHTRVEPFRQAHLCCPIAPDNTKFASQSAAPGWGGPIRDGAI